jgi:hypothetical protein
MDSTAITDVVHELVDQSARTCEVAIRCTLECQQAGVRMWMDGLRNPEATRDWQRQAQAMFNAALRAGRGNVSTAMQIFSENTAAGLDVMEKAFQAAQNGSGTDLPTKGWELWATMLTAMRTGAQSVVQTNARILESSAELARRVYGNAAA